MIVVCALFALAGCGGKVASIPPAPASIPTASTGIPTSSAGISGTFSLRTINGGPLPYTAYSVGPSNKREIVSDVITLREDGTWISSSRTRRTVDDVASVTTRANSGTYTRNGTAVTLTNWSPNGPVSATLVDGKLTIADGALVLVYRE